MPKGLKATSSTIIIGASVLESAANTFTQANVDLQLNPLDNEVFVVVAVDMDAAPCDAIAATNTRTTLAMTTTSQAAMPSLASSNVIARKSISFQGAGLVDGGYGIAEAAGETPPTTLDYVGIIATNDFFLQIEGVNNGSAKSGAVKVYGYRAKAESSVYAALVQSEVLSS